MKKVLLSVAVLGTILLTACEKDNTFEPAEKTLLKADKGLMCRGCGDWDIVAPEEGSTLRAAVYDGNTDTLATSGKKPKKGKGKGK